MKQLVVLAFLFLSVSLSAQTPADTNKTDTQGRKQGLWNENINSLKGTGHYIDNKKTGIWQVFHQNGMLKSVEEYKDGNLNGLAIEMDQNGRINKYENYINGKLEGECRYYSNLGRINVLITYKDGVQNGLKRT